METDLQTRIKIVNMDKFESHIKGQFTGQKMSCVIRVNCV